MPPWLPGFLLVGDWGDPHPTTQKIVFPPLLCPKNVDYVIFMQFLAILPKLSPPQVDPIWETLFDAKVKILKTCLSGLAEIAFLPSFFFIRLVVLVHAYIMSKIAFILKGQKVLFHSFLVRLGENLMENLISLFFLNRKDQQIKFQW